MKNIAYLLLSVSLFSYSQNSDIHSYSSWSTVIVDYNINTSFYLKNEVHLRRTNFLSDWQQFIIRPSIHYKLNKTVDLSAGYSFLKNYHTTRDFNENNVWQQLLLSHHSGSSKFKHRFRLEERFIEQINQLPSGAYVTDGAEFAMRLRYRFTYNLPLITVVDTKKISLTVFDEIWLNTDKGIVPKSINQNWFYAGISYPILKKGSLGVGFMSDYAPLGNDTYRTNNILQTTLKYHIN